MCERQYLSDARVRDFQTAFNLIGGILMTYGVWLFSSGTPWEIAGMWFVAGLVVKISVRQYDPDRVTIWYRFLDSS